MFRTRHIVLFLGLAAAGICQANPVNLVTNGSFETGNFSGWTLTGNTAWCLFVGTSGDTSCYPTTSIGPQSGTYAAELGNAGGDATLSQSIATTGGGTFDVSFWLASQAFDPPSNDFSVTWGGTTLMSQVNLPAFGYTKYDFSGLTAAGPTTTLAFHFENNPSYFILDSISVVDPPAAVPEPSTMVPLGLAAAIAVVAAGRRKRALAVAASAAGR